MIILNFSKIIFNVKEASQKKFLAKKEYLPEDFLG